VRAQQKRQREEEKKKAGEPGCRRIVAVIYVHAEGDIIAVVREVREQLNVNQSVRAWGAG